MKLEFIQPDRHLKNLSMRFKLIGTGISYGRNPYENHRARTTRQVTRTASYYCRLLEASPEHEREVLKKYLAQDPIVCTTLGPLAGGLQETRRIFNKVFADFQQSDNPSPADKLPEQARILERQIRTLFAKCQILDHFGNYETHDAEHKLPIALIANYANTYRIQIPLYDKLYEEFDELQQQSPVQEIYVLRDGIHAFDGRRAQDVARRRKMGVWERLRKKRVGERARLNLKYIVYPRCFIDILDRRAKIMYLSQHGITLESNPHFFDTGFRGTVPEDILHNLGCPDKEIDQKITLLQSRSDKRQAKYISDSSDIPLTTAITDYIEDGAKPELQAEGLFYNPKTGRIEHIAGPTKPQDQFRYELARLALRRHYYLQELPNPFVSTRR